MRTETLPSALSVKEEVYRPWYKSRPGHIDGRGVRDYYTHPSEDSLSFTSHVNTLSRKQDIKTQWTQKTGKLTPYKFECMQELPPRYLDEHNGANGQYPFYRPLTGPLGGQYQNHPGTFKRGVEDDLGTTYSHDYNKRHGARNANQFMDLRNPITPATGAGSGYQFSLNKANWMAPDNKGQWLTTQKDHFRPQALNKAVCCLDDEDPNEKCGFCDETELGFAQTFRDTMPDRTFKEMTATDVHRLNGTATYNYRK